MARRSISIFCYNPQNIIFKFHSSLSGISVNTQHGLGVGSVEI